MKKIKLIVAILFVSFGANAQESFNPLNDRQLIFELINICAVLLVVYIILTFILQIVRHSFEYRLKNKMIERHTTETIVGQLLQPPKKNQRNIILQWFFILTSIGVGFALINIFRPFGLHSLTIMAFSIAAGFGGYYFSTRSQDRPVDKL